MIPSIDSQSIQSAAAAVPDEETASGLRARIAELTKRIDPEKILPPEPPAYEGNRAVRRAKSAFDELRALRNWSRIMKTTAWVTTVAMLHLTFASTPGLSRAMADAGLGGLSGLFSGALHAQPNFQDFDERSKQDAERFVDRASRLNDRDAWTNYVELGIASEFIEWEEEALEQVRQEFQNIDEDENLDDDQKEFEKDLIRAQYEAAALAWEADAEDYLFTERGEYRAEAAEVTVDEITEEEYAAIIADAEATLNATAELDLTAWDAAIAIGRDALETRFEDSLAAEMTRIRGENTGLTGDELAAFNAALTAKEAEVRSEFNTRDHFYVLSSRNSYVARKRADDVSARLLAEQQSADSVGDQIIDEATDQVSAQTNDLIDEANNEINTLTDVPDFDPASLDELAGNWEAKMEAVVDAGLRRWEQAEEQLYSSRIAWLNESKRTREEGEAIWKANHEKLKAARTTWLEELQAKVEEGRLAWEAKFAEFNESRNLAQLELQDYVNEEQARRDAALAQLGDLVRGGGGALAEARDAYYYYTDLLANMETPFGGTAACGVATDNNARIWCFYVQQRDSLAGSLGRFQQILADAEGTLVGNMHSGDNTTGFLNDRRLYAGTLPADVAAIAAGDYRDDLEALMASRPDDFLLYQRDISELIDRNELFTQRANDLEGLFDYASAGSVDQLRDLFNGANGEGKYDDHAREIERIIAIDRSALPDDAARLAAIKTEIAAWFTTAKDEDARLKIEATDYFTNGLGGYYLSGNENDPYLMTDAEYEWEMLRRERMYLAKRLHRAEAVKRYAEIAEQFESGLEMAQVTAERTDIANQRSDLRELTYMLLKGDLVIDPRAQVAHPAYDPAIRDAELNRLLSERGIDPVFLAGREADLQAEVAILNDVASIGTPTAGNLGAVLADIDNYLTTRVPADAQDGHRLDILRDKLLNLRSGILAGDDAGVIADRWVLIGGGAGALRDEVTALIGDYDFTDLNAELNRARTAVGEAQIPQLREAVYVVKDQMELNATELATARAELDLAKERYRDALIDLKVLQAGNSQELIKLDVINNTKQLAAVLNRMQEIETIPGFENTVHDAVSFARVEHLYTISEGERARADFQAAEGLLLYVQGLENAKQRKAALETMLGANNLDAMSATARADLVIANIGALVDQVSPQQSLQSMSGAQQAANTLAGLRGQYDAAAQAVTDKITAGDPLEEIELARKKVSDLELAMNQAIESLATAIRGEEEARRTAIVELLGGAAVDDAALLERWQQDQSELTDRAYARGEAVATEIQNFLDNNRGKSFGELLELANQNIAAAQAARNLRTGAAHDGNGLATTGEVGDVTIEIQSALREWLVANQAAIDYTNKAPESGDFDQRGTTEKWDALVEFADDLRADAQFYRTFADDMPDSAGDTWVVNYTVDRTGLLGRLDVVLANSNAALAGAYGALSAADRDVLLSYGRVEDFNASDLRASLDGVRQSLAADTAAVSGGDYRRVYLRETQIEKERELRAASLEYNALNRRLSEERSERSELERYRDELTAERDALNPVADAARIAQLDDQITDINDRLTALGTSIAALETQIAAPEARMRAAQNHLREIAQPGSTAPLLAQLDAGLGFERASFEAVGFQLQLLENQKRDVKTPRRETTADQVKAAIGFYRTDAAGEILRDSAGNALISQEFIDLGHTDPNMDLADALSGSQTGPNLERWSERLIDWIRTAEASAAADPATQPDPEVTAAVRQLERGIGDVMAARAFIENRAVDPATLEAQASADAQFYGAATGKLALLIQFEGDLANAIYQAEQNNADPAEAALAFLEKYENRHMFQLFAGFGADGEPDSIADANLQARVDELQQLAERLRNNRKERAIGDVAGQYAQYMEQYLADFSANANLRPVEAADFIGAFPQMDGTGLIATINGLGDTDFRANLWGWLNANPAASRLYRSETIAALTEYAGVEDAALKAAVLARLNAFQTDIGDSLAVLTGDMSARTIGTRDAEVTESVANYIIAYNTRGDFARAELVTNGLLASVADATPLGTAQGLLANHVNTALEGAMYNEVRLDLLEMIYNASTDTATLKAAMIASINGLANPVATGELEDNLYQYNLRRALAVSAAQDAYDETQIPEELREFVLIREYTRANERYAEYLAARGSDTETEQAAALSLTGLMGDMARAKAVEDFTDYLAANSFTAYINAPENKGKRGVADYINEYFNDRNTSAALLGPAAGTLYEMLAQLEYQRLAADSGGAYESVNEQDYSADFQRRIVIAYVEDYMARNGATITGASEADRKASYKAIFENVLDDATYSHGGETLRQRLLAKSKLEYFEQITYAQQTAGTVADEYLPDYLDQLRSDAELGNAVKTASDYLPAELLAIAGYAAADYKAIAAGVDQRYADELARVEIYQGATYTSSALYADAAEIDAIIARTGYDGVLSAALRTEVQQALANRAIAQTLAEEQADALEKALAVVRNENVVKALFPTSADEKAIELFFAGEGARFDAIEQTVFAQLQGAHGDIRDAARTNRGEFIAAVIARSTGGTTAYYNALSADLQTELDAYQAALWAELDANQRAALQGNAANYQQAFELRSAQELANSQLFTAFETTLFAYINRAATDAQLASARQNKAGLLKAYLETIQAENGVGSVSAASAAVLSSTGLGALITAAVAEADPQSKELAAREAALISRYLDAFQESDAQRAEILAVLEDPATIDAFAAKGIGYNNAREQSAAARESRELTAALSGTVQDHSRIFIKQQAEYSQRQQIALRLREFASQRGDDEFGNRFANYRTYIETSRGFQQTDFQASGEPDFEDFNDGLVLAGDSLGLDPTSLFAAANWEEQLISDNPADVADTVDVGGVITEIRRVRTVADEAARNAIADNNARLAYLYNENLANNYLDAVSRLNAAFNNVFTAAGFADARHATPADERIAAQIATYDPSANAGTNDITALTDAKSDALARQSAYGQVQIQQKQQAISGAEQTIVRAGEEFADAGRRAVLSDMNVAAYLNSFQPIADEFAIARDRVDALALVEENLRNDYANANQNLVNGLNEMAKRYRGYQAANDEYEMRLSIQDYAETPYLLNTGDDTGNIEDWANNAREEYERAVLVMEQHDQRMEDQRFAVLTQDNLAELYTVATEIESGTVYAPLTAVDRIRLAELQERKHRDNETLSAAEETELRALLDREIAEQYGDLIATRTDHIKHTMRMVRIHKAREIINAEIAKREAIAEEKRRQFDQAVGQFLGGSNIEARNAVYQRLAAQAETGNLNYYNEFRGWFWGGATWMNSIGAAAQGMALNGGFNVTPSQILEAGFGIGAAASIPGADSAAIAQWMASGGSLMEFSGFTGVYTAYMMSLMNHDVQLVRNAIVTTTMSALLATGYSLYASATASAAVLGPLVAGQIASATAMIAYAQSQIVISNAQYLMAMLQTLVMASFSFMSAGVPRITGVMQKQYEYEEAQAALNYFTKVPDVATLKDRVIQWGANPDVTGDRKDPYTITEEDLIYLFEEDGAGDPDYRASNGTTQTLTAEEQSEALNLTSFSNNTEYKDIYGRVYDPTTIVYGQPGPRQGGFYISGTGEQYTRIQVMGHNGALTWAYARIDNSGTQRRVFNIGTVMDMTVQHGTDLRDQRRDAYVAAGNAATSDDTFRYQERDATFQQLFQAAGAEGRSYTGYQITYDDYEKNQADVFQSELQQRRAVQLQEWALREQELNDRYEEWQRKMDAIMARGRESWGNAENRFLQEWREWERKVDNEEREGNDRWDEQIAEHFTNKKKWEEDLRNKASEESIREVLTESINDLNSQILMVRQNIQDSTLSTINTTAFVNNAVAELVNLRPSFTEQFEDINSNIANFKTKLSISELVGSDLTSGAAAVDAAYREELRTHEKNMQVQAKVKVFEEYKRMLDEFAFQIQLQNDAIAQQTAAAAMAQGFAPSGAGFVKMSSASGALGFVNAYAYFEAQQIIADELKKIGFEQREGDELIDFLVQKDDVEVEAYFYTQRLALQHVFSVIMGEGDSEERKESQDERVIGKFGTWAGRQGGNNLTQAVDQVASDFKSVQQLQDPNMMSLVRNFGGFGEQGAMGFRPGGASLGFYPQLELMNRIMGNADSAEFEELGSSIDPVSAMINQFNPMVMMMNSYMNVETAAASGRSRGYMWEAQTLNMLKQPLAIIGSGLMAAAPVLLAGGITAPLAGLAYIAGLAVSGVANSIQVNPTTGERLTRFDGRAAVQTGIAATTSVLPGVGGAIAGTATNVASQGIQYNDRGNISGYSLAGKAGEAALITGVFGAAATVGGYYAASTPNAAGTGRVNRYNLDTVKGRFADGMLRETVSTPFNTLGEYYKQQNLGAEFSSYSSLARPDLSRLGSLASTALSGAIGVGIGEYVLERRAEEAQALEAAQRARDQGDTATAAQILAGIGYNSRRRQTFLNAGVESDHTIFSGAGLGLDDIGAGIGGAISSVGGSIAGGLAWATEGLGWESGANWMRGRGYETNEALQVAEYQEHLREKELMEFATLSAKEGRIPIGQSRDGRWIFYDIKNKAFLDENNSWVNSKGEVERLAQSPTDPNRMSDTGISRDRLAERISVGSIVPPRNITEVELHFDVLMSEGGIDFGGLTQSALDEAIEKIGPEAAAKLFAKVGKMSSGPQLLQFFVEAANQEHIRQIMLRDLLGAELSDITGKGENQFVMHEITEVEKNIENLSVSRDVSSNRMLKLTEEVKRIQAKGLLNGGLTKKQIADVKDLYADYADERKRLDAYTKALESNEVKLAALRSYSRVENLVELNADSRILSNQIQRHLRLRHGDRWRQNWRGADIYREYQAIERVIDAHSRLIQIKAVDNQFAFGAMETIGLDGGFGSAVRDYRRIKNWRQWR